MRNVTNYIGDNTKEHVKLSICILGILILLANSIVLYLSFLHAYFYNNFMFISNINGYGEAHIELIVLSMALIIAFFTALKMISVLTKRPVF